MRSYQKEIINAVICRKNWAGSHVVVSTKGNTTEVYFYASKIAVVNHEKKTAKYDNHGYNNSCTLARINAVKMACKELGYC